MCGQNTDIFAQNMPERVVSIVVYLLAALFFAYVIAVVTDQLSAYTNHAPSSRLALATSPTTRPSPAHHPPGLTRGSYVNDPTHKAMDDLNTFIRFHRVDKHLEARLKSYYTQLLSTKSMVNEKNIIDDLTPSLKDEVIA